VRTVLGDHRVDRRVIAVVGDVVVAAHRRTEAQPVEVEQLHLVPCCAQPGTGPLGDGVAEAVRVGMCEHHHDLHAQSTLPVA